MMRNLSPRFVLAVASAFPACLPLLITPTVAAQQRQTIEIGALGQTTDNQVTGPYHVTTGPSSISLLGTNHEQIFAGPMIDYTWGISRHLMLESRAAYLFGKQPIQSLSGGNVLLVSAGLRTATDGKRIRFYDRIAPGFVSFSQAGEAITQSGWQTARSTDFALDQGIGMEVQADKHDAIRMEFSSIYFVEKGSNGDAVGGFAYTLPGTVENHPTFSLGLAHAFGKPLPEDPNPGTFSSRTANEVTLAYALQVQPHLNFNGIYLSPDSGLAVSAAHDFRSWIGIDTSAILLPGGDQPNYQDGGTESEFYAGPRIGLQRKHYAAFAKYRFGAVTFASTINQNVASPPPVRAWDFAQDAGAIIELYPRGPHWLLRIDADEQATSYHSVQVSEPPPINSQTQSATATYSPLLLIGAGWRF